MDRFLPDSKKRRFAETSPYVEAYDEAVDSYLKRDSQVWEKLLTFHEQFRPRAWEEPMPDLRGRVGSQR
jgi:hypothetical protein